jgi:transmembrane 9 superfamily protein 3
VVQWQWTAFFSGASTSIYVYLYSFYYFAFKTKMTGFFQTCFYFGYTAMFCLGEPPLTLLAYGTHI